MKFLIAVITVLFVAVSFTNGSVPIFGYFDNNVFDDTIDPNLDYVSLGGARSLYEIDKHKYEGRSAFMFMQYFPPKPYVVEQRFTNALDAIAMFTSSSDVNYIHICDEPYLSGSTKLEMETMIAHAKSRLPGYKIAISFGGVDLDTPQNVADKGGFPDNLDLALINWYPFTEAYTNKPSNEAEFDTAMQNMLDIIRPLADPNTKFIIVAQTFKNIADSFTPPADSIAWYADWVDSESDIEGLIMYRYQGIGGAEYGTKELDSMYSNAYSNAQALAGHNWSIATSITPPTASYPGFPSTFDRQLFRTFASHDGWDNWSGATQWMGVFSDEYYSGTQSLRIRTTANQGNHISRPVPVEAQEYGQMEMYVKVSNLAGESSVQLATFFFDYQNNDVAGTWDFTLFVNAAESNNYLTIGGSDSWPTDTGFPITGGWDKIVIKWDTRPAGYGNDIYKVWVNGAGPAVKNGPYGNTETIKGVRLFAAQDSCLPADPSVYDPPVGLELWVDDIDVFEAYDLYPRELMYGVNSGRYGKADLEGYGGNEINGTINWSKWVAPMAEPEIIDGKEYEAIAVDNSGYFYKVDFETGSALGYWASSNWDSIYPLKGDPDYNYVAMNAGRVAKLNIPAGYVSGYDASWNISVTWNGVQSVCPLYEVTGYNAAFVSSDGSVAKLDTITMTGGGIGGAGVNWTQISPLRGDDGWQLVGINAGRIGKISATASGGYGSHSVSATWNNLLWAASASGDSTGRNAMFLNTNGEVAQVDTLTWTGGGVGGAGSNWAMMLEDSIPVGDINTDTYVDLSDIAALAQEWFINDCGAPAWCFGADIYKDGKVDFTDLADMLDSWLMRIWGQ